MPSGVYPRRRNSILAMTRERLRALEEENRSLHAEVESLKANGAKPTDPLVMAALRLARADIRFKVAMEVPDEEWDFAAHEEYESARRDYFAAQDAFLARAGGSK